MGLGAFLAQRVSLATGRSSLNFVPPAGSRLDFYVAVMELDDPVDHRKTYPAALILGREVEIKYTPKVLRGDPDTRILHREALRAPAAACRAASFRAPPSGMACTAFSDRLISAWPSIVESPLIGGRPGITSTRKSTRVALRLRTDHAGNLVEEHVDVDGLQLHFTRSRELQEALDDLVEASDLVGDDLGVAHRLALGHDGRLGTADCAGEHRRRT